ncbi:hypothetical protein AWB75_02167 [Caballeronia catudaia]|uniref:Uncharacterized protein n=1 Tax=Caballeronia catudaia TaxID=1777136 RepID=A0A158AH28_9BURK|nr:hypothetical protein AWB75_02167 [Caballeronia catudaia]
MLAALKEGNLRQLEKTWKHHINSQNCDVDYEEIIEEREGVVTAPVIVTRPSEPPARQDECFELFARVIDMALQKSGSRTHVSRPAQTHEFAVLFLCTAAAFRAERQLQARIAIGLLQKARHNRKRARLFCP